MANLFFFLPLLLPPSLSHRGQPRPHHRGQPAGQQGAPGGHEHSQAHISVLQPPRPHGREAAAGIHGQLALSLTPSFSLLLSPGSSRDGEKYRFLLKFLSKSNDFDCPGWPGAAGMEKSIDYLKIPFKK